MAQFLVLEEDKQQFEQIKSCLQANGHKGWHAAASSEAFDFLSQYGVELILCAVRLENGDVFEFLRQIKSSERLKHIPFVFYATEGDRCDRYATPVIMHAGKALGAREYVLLPKFDANRFWESLQAHIPEKARKNDALGGEIKTYSINEFAWTKRDAS